MRVVLVHSFYQYRGDEDSVVEAGMGQFIAEQTVEKIIRMGEQVKNARVNILGLTFKENCADIRNTKAVDIVHELESYGI
jgi:UDP-N-acetyl-D-galactosamine dehydrogenase